METKSIDGESTPELTTEEIQKLQAMMAQIGISQKSSGGNKAKISPAKRKSRRLMQKASRKVNRSKNKHK